MLIYLFARVDTDHTRAYLEFVRELANMDQSSLQDKYPGWGPSGFSPEILEEVEGGVDAENNADVGTDQPTDDIEHLVNHFKETGRVSEDELTKHLIYLTYKYSHIQLQGGSYSDKTDERTHKVHATVELNAAPECADASESNSALKNANSSSRPAHKVLATAVAKGDNYSKVIDESKVDFSESRVKELNGLLETTLKEVTIDEAGDANICGSKWVVHY
jgi:hypothetical protein